jgi:hypothetical protein
MRRERKTLRVVLYPVLPHWARFVSRPDQGVGTHKPCLRRFFGVTKFGGGEKFGISN